MSGSVFLNNLDDFIAPSQACVNPLVNGSSSSTAATSTPSTGGVSINRNSKKHARVTLETDFSKSDFDDFVTPSTEPDLIKQRIVTSSGSSEVKKIATVSLNDCLACSGCVTSAEAVLIQEQSSEKLTKLLEDNKEGLWIVVQISPNSRASIAEFLGMSSIEFFLRAAALLKKIGVHYVLDSSAGSDVALVESREEFLQRLKGGRSKRWEKPETTTALSSSAVTVYPEYAQRDVGDPTVGDSLPILTSHCPGWVCYAEKTSPQAIPYMSTVKSAQQIVGTVIKNILLNDSMKKSADSMVTEEPMLEALERMTINDFPLDSKHQGKEKKVFVVSVQPCYDKKLEASRRDFYHVDTNANEVDLVLSTTEFWQLIESYAWKSVGNANTTSSTPTMDFDDVQGTMANSSKKIRLDTEFNSNSDQMLLDVAEGVVISNDSRKQLVQTSFKHVLDYMQSMEPDPVHGGDEIERLFRCFSETGQHIMSSAEKNAASGGYTEYLFKHAAEQLFQINLWDQLLQYKEGRNADLAEIDIKAYLSEEQKAVADLPNLKFSRAYGFRNIQSILLKMKRGTCDYDLVEIMACPSGCSNGGGQLKTLSSILPLSSSNSNSPAPPRSETPAESKDRITVVEAQYHAELMFARPDDNPLVKYLYDNKRLEKPLSAAARHVLHTRYHAVPKLETIAPLAAKW